MSADTVTEFPLQPSTPGPDTQTTSRAPVPLSNAAKSDRQPSFSTVTELHKFLEHRSRQLSMTIRLMEQQRKYLRSIELQRDDDYKKLTQIVATVAETASRLKTATEDETKTPRELEGVLEKNRIALDELENISAALRTDFLCWRSAWEQYLQTCVKEKELRSEMSASEPLTDA